MAPPVFKTGLSLLVGDGRFDSFPSPPNLRLLLSTDAGNYSQLLNWQISERWLLGKRCSEDIPTKGGENTLRPACVEHAQPESRSSWTASPNSWARIERPGAVLDNGRVAGTQEERLPATPPRPPA